MYYHVSFSRPFKKLWAFQKFLRWKKKKKISLNYFITQLKLLPSCMFHWVESVYMLSTNLSREKLLTYNEKRKIHAHQILASK